MTFAPASCRCTERVNKTLVESNVQIRLVDGVPVLKMYKIDKNKQGRLPVVAARYCPFCGREVTA
jgi:hypothetical protein